jgi:hypothetical protein
LLVLFSHLPVLIPHHNVFAKPKGLQILQNGANLDSIFIFSDDKSRWFFKKQGGGCSTHIGHCHLHPKQVKATSTTLDKDEYELVLQQLQMNNSNDDLGGGFDQESNNDSAAAKHPYPELIPTFVSINDLVQTAGDLAFVRKEMNQIYSVLLSRKHKAGPAGNMVLLPEVDQRRKDKRMKPMGSPEKR